MDIKEKEYKSLRNNKQKVNLCKNSVICFVSYYIKQTIVMAANVFSERSDYLSSYFTKNLISPNLSELKEKKISKVSKVRVYKNVLVI